ncbi:hypothetical protein [Tessaracoccus sp.]
MTPFPIAFVHHANQFVITDGYADRDGVSTTAAGYDAVLSLHVECGIPASLHISGPALEAIAWHRPALLARLRTHLDSGLITLIGGTYGENIMPISTPRQNRRQLRAFHEVAEDLLGVPRHELRTAWVPERVWETSTCAPPLRDRDATGVRYQRVLLDDRLTYGLNNGRHAGSAREQFDADGPYRWHNEGFPDSIRGRLRPESLMPYRIADGDGLVGVPIASHLRYLVPPHDTDHLRLLEELAEDAQQSPEGSLMVFADDLERVAGVAGWEQGLERYARFLRWLSRSAMLKTVPLDAWCDRVVPEPERPIEAGTYFELAHHHGAGEDYSNWANDPRWSSASLRLDQVEAEVERAESDGAEAGLCRLAERLLMLGRHETAWQDHDPETGRAPAPWMKATAAHAADGLPVLAAARWANGLTGAGLCVRVADVDGDGHEEILLSSDHLFAVLSPHCGGRLSLLVRRDVDSDGVTTAAVVVGNPADHWNFQSELHQHMHEPPNHPGALSVLGTETHRHDLGRVEVTSEYAIVDLIDVEPGADRGLTKRVLLTAEGKALVVSVSRPGLPGELRTTVALSPDYLGLLRGGRHRVRRTEGHTWFGASSEAVHAWVAHDPAESTDQLVGTSPTTGHAVVGAVDGCGRQLHVVIGTGPVDDATGPALIAAAHQALQPALGDLWSAMEVVDA